ncbi:MAG TPA: hypothetical protein PKC73_15600, partial [Dermatophilaceae bacterium]|nr:hypothetical protein [Dermatophilaceae bacterium]
MPPRHLADLAPAERKAAVEELGHRGFRAGQLSKHYFERLVDAPEEMTDLPGAARAEDDRVVCAHRVSVASISGVSTSAKMPASRHGSSRS